MGKLDEGDYRDLKRSLEDRALSAMSAIERAARRSARCLATRGRAAGAHRTRCRSAAAAASPSGRRTCPAPLGAGHPPAVNFCPQCGVRVGAGHNFCAECGTNLNLVAMRRVARRMMDAAPIEARGLDKAFGSVPILRGLNLAVPAGTATIIAGRNGAGKSTLVRLLAGLSAPSAGEALLFGMPSRTLASAARRRLAIITHQSFLYPNLTARENLEFYGKTLWRCRCARGDPAVDRSGRTRCCRRGARADFLARHGTTTFARPRDVDASRRTADGRAVRSPR